MGNWTKQNFLKRRNSNGQKTHAKILTISSHKGNATQNHTKILPYPVRIAIIKNTTNNRCWWECGEKGTLVTLLVEMYASTTTLEKNLRDFLEI
jgi:hypothetical protein